MACWPRRVGLCARRSCGVVPGMLRAPTPQSQPDTKRPCLALDIHSWASTAGPTSHSASTTQSRNAACRKFDKPLYDSDAGSCRGQCGLCRRGCSVSGISWCPRRGRIGCHGADARAHLSWRTDLPRRRWQIRVSADAGTWRDVRLIGDGHRLDCGVGDSDNDHHREHT